ncbi:hypothetical protein KMM349_22800 [Stenotrophomonas maltophilia]|nr:hypothetical protein KMM349_22800 [Stenotrophomonas maltophilia]
MERANVVDQDVQIAQRGLVITLRHAGIGKCTGTAEVQRVAIIGGGGVRRGPAEATLGRRS